MALTECLTLRNMNFTINKGEFVVVVGSVGCGKTSLLHAIAGNLIYIPEKTMKFQKGKTLTKDKIIELAKALSKLKIKDTEAPVQVSGSIAFAEAKSWIENKTIKETILFGKEYDEKRYKACIKACQLEGDLKELKGGDDTQLGENGINLSGGQKARVTLARSVYADSEIVLLDDPVSALDAKVGKAVFNEVIRGICKEKTTIMATHAVDFFELADKIILLDNGEIEAFGPLSEIRDNKIMKVIMSEHEEQRKRTLETA